MSDGNTKLCMGCMMPLEDGEICPNCGYCSDEPDSPDYLLPSTMLTEQYLVGKVLYTNGEGVLYIGFDVDNQVRVFIKEYMPEKIAARNHSDFTVHPISGNELQYKYLMNSFQGLAISLKDCAEVDCLVPILDIFHKNNTVYIVYRYISTMTLGEFLHKKGGELLWADAKKIFMPLFNAVSTLHSKGIIHRGISPSNILINRRGKLFLTGFALDAVRTNKGELPPELFSGYSAPEQYSEGQWQGTWSDVYALAAVLYKTLTGTQPPDAAERLRQDNLLTVSQMNVNVPQNVSDAVEGAMQLPIEKRIQTVDLFTGQLLESVESNTAVYAAPTVTQVAPSSAKSQDPAEKKTAFPMRTILLAMIPTVVVLGIVFVFIFGNLVKGSSQGSSSAEELSSSQTAEDIIPSFVGKYVTTVTSDNTYTQRYNFTVQEEYDETVPKGIIIRQSPEEGVSMVNKGTVILTVSKGSRLVTLPNLVGSSTEFAMRTLEEHGITNYEVIEVEDENAKPDVIIRTEPLAGTSINLDGSTKVLLLVKKSGEGSGDETSQQSDTETPPPEEENE